MRPTRRSKILGIAIGERMALVAEVSSTGGRSVVHHVAEFHYPPGMDLARPDLLGRVLGDFLGKEGISSRAAVFGIPGKWVLSMNMQAPPAGPDMIADTLRLQAEGEFAADNGDFVYDYAGETSSSEARSVLLMAIQGRHLEQVKAIATAASLKAIAITPYAMTLGAVGIRTAKASRVLLMGPAGAEFVSHGGGHAQSLKYLGPSSSAPAFLAGELRRVGAVAEANKSAVLGVSGSGGSNGELLLWNDARLESGAVRAVGESLGGAFKVGEPQTLGVIGSSSAHAPAGYATAVSLALAGLDAVQLPVDFLHSRLEVKKQARIPQRSLIIAGAASIVLLAGLWGYSDIRSRQAALDQSLASEKDQVERVKSANLSVTRISFAQGWQNVTPKFIECMNDLTASLPEDGRAYITSFTLNGELKGQLIGKAREDGDVLVLADRLSTSNRFKDVTQSYAAAPKPSTKKPAGAAPTPQPPPGPTPPPTAAPPSAPPAGANPGGLTPEQMDALAAAVKEGKPPPPELMATLMSMPRDQQKALEKVMRERGAIPGGGPPPPAAVPQPPPQVAAAPEQRPDRPPKGEAGAAPAGEVTFLMTFNYVPKKK